MSPLTRTTAPPAPSAPPALAQSLHSRRLRYWLGMGLALVVPVVLTAALFALTEFMHLPSHVLLAGVVAVALIGGLYPAITSAVLASLGVGIFLTGPVGSLYPLEADTAVFALAALTTAVAVSLAVHGRHPPREDTDHDLTTAVDNLFTEHGADGWSAVVHTPGPREYLLCAPYQSPEETAQHYADGLHKLTCTGCDRCRLPVA